MKIDKEMKLVHQKSKQYHSKTQQETPIHFTRSLHPRASLALAR